MRECFWESCCRKVLLAAALGCCEVMCYDGTAANTEPQQQNSKAPAWPGAVLTPARCGRTAAGRWKQAEAGLYFGLVNKEGPLRNGFTDLLPRPVAHHHQVLVASVSSERCVGRGVFYCFKQKPPYSSCRGV